MKPTHYHLSLDEFIFGYSDATDYSEDQDAYYNPNSCFEYADSIITNLLESMPGTIEHDTRGKEGLEFWFVVEAAKYPFGTNYYCLSQN
jgi:hypothetical protein